VNRVLVTGGAGTIGAAVVRRLLRDPDFEVCVSDQRDAPPWMREGCEVHTGDVRLLDEARKATQGCSHVIHLAAIVGGIANLHKLPHTQPPGVRGDRGQRRRRRGACRSVDCLGTQEVFAWYAGLPRYLTDFPLFAGIGLPLEGELQVPCG
jgi:NAD dependent epimerase/dehydratase family